MRVCLVSYEYPPKIGGEASYTRNLAVGLAQLGHEVTLVIPGVGPALASDVAKRSVVRVVNLPLLKVGSFMLAARKEVGRLARGRAIDLAHVTFDYPSLPVGLSDIGVPTVATVHHLHQAEAMGMLRARSFSVALLPSMARSVYTTLMERALLAGASSVIAVSDFTRGSLARYSGVPEGRVSVIPNGIDAAPFLKSPDAGRLRDRFALGSNRVILYVGRLEPSKGVEYLIRAFKAAKEGKGALSLLIVGSGSSGYVSRLRGLAASLGVEGDVAFAGRLGQEELYEAYSLAALVVLPSLMEGFGMSIIEAMASGKPCVATSAGALPEIIQQGQTGLLVSPGDSAGLAGAMQRVLEDPAEAERMGERGRRLVLQRYSLEEMARRTEVVYRGLTEGRRAY